MPLAFLPIMITSCINALVALTRIGDFLKKPESGLEALRKAAETTPPGHVKVGCSSALFCSFLSSSVLPCSVRSVPFTVRTLYLLAALCGGLVWQRCAVIERMLSLQLLTPCNCLLPVFCCIPAQVEKGVFSWESDGDTKHAYMQGINFSAKPGTLTMVVGSVASGKTSLLSALIGQMERLQGTVAVGGRVAYVAQTAWIINDSVQVGGGPIYGLNLCVCAPVCLCVAGGLI